MHAINSGAIHIRGSDAMLFFGAESINNAKEPSSGDFRPLPCVIKNQSSSLSPGRHLQS